MPTPLPREPSGSSNLAQTVKQLIRCIKERTPLESTEYSIERHADGFFQRPRVKSETVAGGNVSFRGVWWPDQFYKEGDIVFTRGTAGGSGGPETHGTFISMRDHTSTIENAPTELLPEQQDPVSGGPNDIWRTFAAGAFETLYIKAFPLKVVGPGGEPLPSIDLPTNTYLAPGSVQCLSPGGSSTMNSSGEVAGNNGANVGRWTIYADDLPLGTVAKFRLVTMCIGGEKHTAYVLMTEPVLMP